MKRILSLFIVLAIMLGALASCELPFLKPTNDGTTKPSGEVVEADIQEAVDYIEEMYGEDKNGTATPNNFNLISALDIAAEDSDDVTEFTIVWTSSTDKVSLVLNEEAYNYTVVVPEDNDEQLEYTLTATITSPKGQTATVEITRVLATSYGMITNPVAGKAYKFALLHGNEKAVVYFDGNNYQSYAWYLAYTQDPLAAVDVYLEEVEDVEGGYRLYFMVGDVKTYIVAFPRDGDTTKGTLKLDTVVPSEYYTFDTTYNTLIYTSVTGEQFYIGSSGTYKSISLSAYSYIDGATSYIGHLYGPGGIKEELPEQTLPEVPENYTSEDVVNALYKLESGQTLEGPYLITGVVTSIKYAYDPGYGNVSVVIQVGDLADKPVLLYRIKGEGADTVKVGDTITVRSGVTNYNGTFETVSGGLIEEIIPGEGGGDTPVVPPVDTDSIVLDLTGNSNLVSGSAEKNVFAANGITLTNNKSSSSSDLVVQESYAQRFYAGSTITIEYEGMTKIVLTLDDFSDGKYLKGFDGMTVEGATITRDNDVVTIVFAAPTNSFTSGSFASQVRCEKIEVFTGEVEDGGDVGGGDDTPVTPAPEYTAPAVDTAFNLYMTLPSGTVYFAGAMDTSYLATTTDATAATSIYFEEVNGGYHIYFYADGVKTYITAAAYLKSNGYAGCHFSLTTDTPTLAWTYNATYGILEIYDEVEGKSDTFFAGTYGSYNTISLSGSYYKDQISSGTQYPARLVLADGSVVVPPVEGGDDTHEHNFVEGKCECGETDPNYVPPVVDGNVLVLNLLGNSNLVSGSGDKNVFAANGITLTNDKASSTVALTVQSTYAQRFYANSTITIECEGMTKIVLTLDDYSDGKYLKGFDGMTVEGATITRDNDVVTIVFAAPTNSFTSTTFTSQVRCEQIEVYVVGQ